MNELQIFNNNLFGQIRTIIKNGKVLFCGFDVAKALGYKRPSDAINLHCRATVKHSTPISGKMQDINFITEGDVYRLIVRSRLPEAEKFEQWIFDEILPQIRKTGGYIPVKTQDDELAIMAKAHQILERTLQEKDNIIEEKSKALQVAQPKADLYDKLMSAEGYVSFNVAAKELGIGRNTLMKMLRDKGILFRDGLSNIAYQKYCKSGYFVVKHSIGKNGYACGVTKVTPKGLSWLCKVINSNNVKVAM